MARPIVPGKKYGLKAGPAFYSPINLQEIGMLWP